MILTTLEGKGQEVLKKMATLSRLRTLSPRLATKYWPRIFYKYKYKYKYGYKYKYKYKYKYEYKYNTKSKISH